MHHNYSITKAILPYVKTIQSVSQRLQTSTEINIYVKPIVFIHKVGHTTSLVMICYDIINSTYFTHQYLWVDLVTIHNRCKTMAS